ncbi:MAG: FAD-binding oxidoreductase [Pseudomonadota bacterium]
MNRLPNDVDVVVIGGGIIGCCTAYFLAQFGERVALCEKGQIGLEQSTRNWGFVRKQGRHPAEIPMMIRSLDLWFELQSLWSDDMGLHRGGTLYLSDDEKRYAANQAWLQHAKDFELDTKFLSLSELNALVPTLEQQARGALYTPSDAKAEPDKAMNAIQSACEAAGVSVLSNCAVRTVDISAGRVSGVVTEHGRIACNRAVVCGGAWSRYFLRHLDVELPQLKVIGSVMQIEAGPKVLDQSIWSNGLGIRHRQDGGYNVAFGGSFDCDLTPDHIRYFRRFLPAYRAGKEDVSLKLGKRFFRELGWRSSWDGGDATPFERYRTLNPKPNEKLLAAAHLKMGALFPPLANLRIVRKWAGMIDVTPDELPVIDAVARFPGLFVSTGYSGHGFGIGPGAGETTAALVSGRALPCEINAFQLDRMHQ